MNMKAYSLLATSVLVSILVPPAYADDAMPRESASEIRVPISQVLGYSPAGPGGPSTALQPLADDGINVILSYIGEAAGNLGGGDRRSSAYAGQVLVGADFDMSKIAGIEGGTLHFGVTNRHGESLNVRAIGNNTSVQEIYGYMGTRLAVLSYTQKVFGDTIEFELGKGAANSRYMFSPLYCNFQSNAVCGNPTFAFKNSNITGFPASTWMANISLRLSEKVALQAGAFEVNPHRTRPDDDNFSFSLKHATGAFIPYELTYGTSSTNDRLPRHYTVGGWFDTGDYSDPLRDDQGGIAILSGRPGMTRNGRSAVYFRFDQMISRSEPVSGRGLTIFGAALLNTNGRVVETNSFQLGLLQKGTFKGRDQDTIGLMASDQRFSDLFLLPLRAARASMGSTQALHRHQYMFELAYGAQLAGGLRISPNLQYILHPDPSGRPFRTTNAGDVLVVGFKFAVDVPQFLGEVR